MGKDKLRKFAEMATFKNVFQNMSYKEPRLYGANNQAVDLKGKWSSQYFKNENPITLELACGKGEYTLALAEKYPDRNFIGVDIKGNRIWRGAKTALDKDLANAAFLRTKIELLHHFFDPKEVEEFWITFADPFLKKPNNRLTAPRFLSMYRSISQSNAMMNLKTDSPELYSFTQGVIMAEDLSIEIDCINVYEPGLELDDNLFIKTHYEKMHLENDRVIKYLRFGLSK